MPDAKRKIVQKQESDLGLEGFEQFFDGESKNANATAGEAQLQPYVEKLVGRMTELISLSVDQRVETAKIANQLIENQRQLVATQQILIRLMERSIELTRHITTIEEKLPAVFELPGMVDKLRIKVAQLEGVEID